MTAAGLPSSRPFIRWMRAIAAGVERIAGEAVDAVGGEDGDAARGDRPLQRRAGRRGAAALQRHDLRGFGAHRAPTTTRSSPARSSPHLDLGEAGVAEQFGDLERLAGADLDRDRGGPVERRRLVAEGRPQALRRPLVQRRQQGAVGVEAVLAGEQRLARLPLGHLRLEPGPFAFGDVGKVGEDEVEALARGDGPGLEADPVGEAEAGGVGARDLERAGRGVGGDDLRLGQLVGDARGRSPRSRCRRRAPGPAAAPAPLRPAARSPAAAPARGCRRPARSGGSLSSRRCRRAARAAAAAAPARRSGAPRPRRSRPPGSAIRLARPRPVTWASSSSASSRASGDPGGGQRVGRRRQRLGRRSPRPAPCPPPALTLPRRPRDAAVSPRPRARW